MTSSAKQKKTNPPAYVRPYAYFRHLLPYTASYKKGHNIAIEMQS